MNRHYDNYLVKKYPPIFRDRYGDMKSTLMCWGFSVGDGWFHLINTLCGTLCSEWMWAKEQYEAIKDREGLKKYDFPDDADKPWNIVVTREMIDEAKAKMDEEAEKVPVAVQVKEKYGGLRFYVGPATDEQHAVIHFAESMSYRICEVCGDKAERNRNEGGWITTRCKKHKGYYS